MTATTTLPHSSSRGRHPTFVPQREAAHLGEVFERLDADGSSCLEAGDADLILLHKAWSRLALLARFLVDQTD